MFGASDDVPDDFCLAPHNEQAYYGPEATWVSLETFLVSRANDFHYVHSCPSCTRFVRLSVQGSSVFCLIDSFCVTVRHMFRGSVLFPKSITVVRVVKVSHCSY